MKFSVALAAALFLPALVNAQYNTPDSTSSSSETESSATPGGTSTTASASTPTPTVPASNSTNINVQVAAGGLVYSPSNFTAANGTIVTFFFSTSIPHSVTQGSFANPCVYLAASGGDPAGFDSGLQSGGKEFSINITNDQEPVWFFCKNADHCGLGMVGAINAPSSGNTFDAWVAAAKALGSNETPISDSGPVTGGVGAVATGTPVPTTSTPTTTSKASATSSKSSSSRLVANGFFALLATAFGITLA